MNKHKVMIAVPAMDMVASPFAQCLAMLKSDYETKIAMQLSSLVYESRNQLAMQAIGDNCDHVLWLDSDMVFSPDTLNYMMAKMYEAKVDIISGIYFRRKEPFTPVFFDHLQVNENGKKWWHNSETVPDELTKVEGIGFGCVLMKTSVLIDVYAEYGTLFSPIDGMGEDLSFCWRARQTGHEIWVDPSITLGHVGTMTVTKAFFDNFKQANKAVDGE